jgi:hypothetical protein
MPDEREEAIQELVAEWMRRARSDLALARLTEDEVSHRRSWPFTPSRPTAPRPLPACRLPISWRPSLCQGIGNCSRSSCMVETVSFVLEKG